MTNPVVDTQKIISPDLQQWQANRKFDLKTEINCMAIGTVQSFNPTNQTVNVLINYLRVIKGGVTSANPTEDTVSDKTVSYPLLVQCPLMINNGGGASITFPVANGDTCLILFNDRDIDNWWSTGTTSSPPNSARLHDLSDAIVIVGIRNVTNAIAGYNMLALQLLYGNSLIAIQKNGIELSVNNITLGTTMNLLMIQLIALATATGNAGIAASLTAIQVTLNGILL